MNAYEKLLACVDSIRKKTDFVPAIGVVLGSGLGEYANEIKVVATVEYSEIEGPRFPPLWVIRGSLFSAIPMRFRWWSWRVGSTIMRDIP